jgi:hypothetical protein
MTVFDGRAPRSAVMSSASVRTSLLSWVAPALVGAVDQLTAAAKAAPTTLETVRSGGGAVVVVSPAGADPTAVAAGVARLQAVYGCRTAG